MERRSDKLTFAGITISRAALHDEIVKAQANAKPFEQMGAALARRPTPAAAFAFSEAVCCEWTPKMGCMVWALLVQYNPDDLGKKLSRWFKIAINTTDVKTALAPGLAIKGLRVSFASKQLRILQPKRFAVLDSVLSRELGFALKPAEYVRFLDELREFRRRYDLRKSIGILENGLYRLIKRGRYS